MTKKKSVWTVEQGEYSDYRVVGIYSKKEFAEKVCEKINAEPHSYEAEVVERPLDPSASEVNKGLDLYEVVMKKDGTVSFINKSLYFDPEDGLNPPSIRAESFGMSVWARSEQHAVKIANEKRAQFIAEGLL